MSLAAVYHAQGERARAEPLLTKAVEIYKQTRVERDPLYAQSLADLARVYWDRGDYDHAGSAFREALEIFKRTLGERDPAYLRTLTCLAGVYCIRGDYARAEPLGRQAVEMTRQALGEGHPEYATSLSTLALVYHLKGSRGGAGRAAYSEAEPLYRKALGVYQMTLGEGHHNYITTLRNLAGLYSFMGDHGRAEPLFLEVLEITKRVLGERHPAYAAYLSDLAWHYHARGAYAAAEPHCRQALLIHEQLLEDTFSVLSERKRVASLRHLRGALEGFLNAALPLRVSPREIYGHVLAWKGAVASRQAEERVAHDQPQLRPLIADLLRVRTRLSRLAAAAPAPGRDESPLRDLDALRQQKEDLEGRLAQASLAYRRDLRLHRCGPAEIAHALPEGAALVDFFEYAHLTPQPGRTAPLPPEQRFLAFVSVRQREPVCVALGPARKIRQAVDSWREALRGGNAPALEAAAAELAGLVWTPLAPHLGGAGQVLVAPDGALCRFPLVALPGRRPGTYLVEDLAIGYVLSGRQVVEVLSESPAPPTSGMLAIGGIADFARADSPGVPAAPRGPWALADERTRAGLGPLPGSGPEARGVLQSFRRAFPGERALLLTGAESHERRIKQEFAARWRYIHLATHGFFAPPNLVSALRDGGAKKPWVARWM
jgi:tetratricopeptide (TPR) repeat protein